MDQDKFNEFKQRVERAVAHLDAKVSLLHQTTGELKEGTNDLKEEMGDFMQFMAEYVTDHEARLKRLEKNAGIQ